MKCSPDIPLDRDPESDPDPVSVAPAHDPLALVLPGFEPVADDPPGEAPPEAPQPALSTESVVGEPESSVPPKGSDLEH